jgi:MSHA biogenesis protein MshE
VVRLLQSMFEDAMQVGASDVHIEPQEAGLQIRVRVDGVLQTQTEGRQTHWCRAGAAPQADGRSGYFREAPAAGRPLQRAPEGHTIDVRLSTLPTAYGESVVMRLLNQGARHAPAGQHWHAEDMLKRFREVLGRSAGLVLVTGPTGSGKTTTLYAALAEINAAELKVITVEDPVEYRLPGSPRSRSTTRSS